MLAPGTSLIVRGLRDGAFVGTPTELDGDEVLPLVDFGGSTYGLGIETTGWFRVDEDGQKLVGQTDDARLEFPRLEVPATVRAGMRWVVPDPDYDGDVAYEVLGSEVLETPWGTGPAWTIRTSTPVEVVWDRVYLEGVGQIERRNVDDGGFVVAGDAQVGYGIRLLDPTDARAPDPPRLALRSLGMSGVIGQPHPTRSSGMVVSPEGGAVVQLGVLHVGTEYINSFPVFVRWARDTCVEVSANGVAVQPAQPAFVGPEAPHPCAPAPAPDSTPGAIHFADPRMALVHASGTLLPSWRAVEPIPIASFVGVDGEVHLLTEQGVAVPGEYPRAQITEWVAEEVRAQGTEPLAGRGTFVTEHESAQLLTASGTLYAAREADADGAVPLLLEDESGMLLHGLYRDGHIGQWRPAGRAHGRITVRSSLEGRDLLHVTEDGVVDRLHLERDGVRRQRLARLELPQRHAVVAAFDQGDGTLLAFTFEHPNWQQDAVDGGVGWEHPFHAWEATLEGAPEPWTPPSALGVTATPDMYDWTICWPEGVGTPSSTGWTMGGHPADAIPSEDLPCVTVLRPLGVDWPIEPGPETWVDPDFDLITGEIPGIGRVLVHSADTPWGYFRDPPRTMLVQNETPGFEAPVALAGGGFITRFGRFGRGGTFLDPSISGYTRVGQAGGASDILNVVGDASGQGLWYARLLEDGSQVVERLGARGEPERYAVTEHVTPYPMLPVRGGGVMVTGGGYDGTLLRPDGTTLPMVGDVIDATVAFADGGSCNLRQPPMSCTRADGSSWVFGDPMDELLLNGVREARELEDGTALVAMAGQFLSPDLVAGLYVLDPVGETFTLLVSGTVMTLTPDGTGDLWVSMVVGAAPFGQTDDPSLIRVARVDGSGLDPVPTPVLDERMALVPLVAGTIVPDDGVLLVFMGPVAGSGPIGQWWHDPFLRMVVP